MQEVNSRNMEDSDIPEENYFRSFNSDTATKKGMSDLDEFKVAGG